MLYYVYFQLGSGFSDGSLGFSRPQQEFPQNYDVIILTSAFRQCNTVSEIDVSSARIFSKTIFSMPIPEVMEVMAAEPDRNAVVLFGIETQVSR